MKPTIEKKELQNGSVKGFSLVELLLAIGIFGIVIAANFALAMDAYRTRQNDRVRVDAGLVVKETLNGLYSYKNDYWSEIIKSVDKGSKKLEYNPGTEKFSMVNGTYEKDGVTYTTVMTKAERDETGIILSENGNDPDTIKVTISASWIDILGIEQNLSETYFLTNWSSLAWTETTTEDFTQPVPTTVFTEVNNGSVLMSAKPVIANDWCSVETAGEDQNVQAYNLFPTGSGSVFGVSAKNNSAIVDYETVEPTLAPAVTFPPTPPAAPENPAIETYRNTSICDSVNLDQTQCETLVKFYEETKGENWTNDTGWLTDTDCSNWYGVTCSGDNVTGLALGGNNLGGKLIPEIGILTGLVNLDLSSNSLDGVIPETIGNLTDLESVDLGANQLDGPIPEQIGRLTELTELRLNDNSLTCHIPPTIGNLTGIQSAGLNLANNNLILTAIPELADYFSSKNALLSGQGAVITSEKCVQVPMYSDEAVVAEFNTSESEDNPIAAAVEIENSEFPLELSKEVYNQAPWLADISNGLSFDGGDIVEVPYSRKWNLVDTDATISMWVKLNGNQSNSARLLDFSESGQGWYVMINASNQVEVLYESDEGGNDISLNSAALNTDNTTWYHIVLVMDSGTATLYVNGASVDTDLYSILLNVNSDSKPLMMGGSGSGNFFNGSLDEIKIYERAVPIAELTKNATVQVDRKDPGLIGYWRLDETNIEQIQVDLSYQGAHGVRGGSLTLGEGDDPSTVTGNTRYRINDISQDGDIVYLASTHPEHDLTYFDKTEENINYQTINNTIVEGYDDTQAVFVDEDSVFFSQGSYLFEYNKSDLGQFRYKNMNQGGDGIANLTDVVGRGNHLYITGLNDGFNFAILDVSSAINQVLPDPALKNLLLESIF